MNSKDSKRIERLCNKIRYYSLKKLEYIKADNLDKALLCTRIIELLYARKSDIEEGIDKLVDKRKKELIKERDAIQVELRSSNLIDRMRLKKELYQVEEDLQEDRLREYARSKKGKTRKKEV